MTVKDGVEKMKKLMIAGAAACVLLVIPVTAALRALRNKIMDAKEFPTRF